MNRLLTVASRSAIPSLRINRVAATTSSSSSPATTFRFLSSVRYFSDDASTPAAGTDDEIKSGTVKFFKNAYGFIVPDGVDMKTTNNEEIVFFHRNAFKRVKHDGYDKFFPVLKRGERVQFKLDPPDEGKASPKAREVTLEGGKPIPAFSDGYLDSFMKAKKARFGTEVYEIFSTSKDQTELETRIVEAYDKVKDEIERQRERVEKAMALENEYEG